MPRPTAEILTSSFLDSPGGRLPDALTVIQRRRAILLLVESALDDLGVEPRLLDGEQVRTLLLDLVARKLGRNDPLTGWIVPLARAFFRWLQGTCLVPNGFEIEMTLAALDGEFESAARAVKPEQRIAGETRTVKHRGMKVGRNEPCPCGSGRKFKQCCMRG
ncbi:MAG: SEC-C metal-binding domain-containing protein [Planctomycetota bacterium]